MKISSQIVLPVLKNSTRIYKSFWIFNNKIFCKATALFSSTVSTLIFLSLTSSAQKTQTAIPWTGSPGITKTVNQIMSLEPNSKPARFSMLREHETKVHKRKNPNASEISSYPVNDQTANRTTGGGNNSIAASQATGANFLASNLFSSGFVPPDCNGAAGPTQILAVSNGRIRVYSKSGVIGVLNLTCNTFFTSVRNGSSISDTHIRYDRLTQRWFVVGINVEPTNNRVVIAMSSGPIISDATSFTFFSFQMNVPLPNGDAGKFLDYPTFGLDANALYIGGVRFDPNNFDGCPLFVVRKSSVLSGGPIVVSAFRNAGGTISGIYVPQGVDNDDPTATEGYFIGTDAGVYSLLNIIRVINPGGTPSITNLTGITVPSNTAPILQVHSGAAANRRLDGLDDRLYAAHVMKNKITGVTTLWTANNTVANSSGAVSGTMDRNVSRWYEIGSLTTSPVLIQAGTLYDNASANPRGFWIPSIAMSGQGHSVLGCSTAGAVNFADAAIAGRYSSDPLGTIQSFTLATSSNTAYNVQSTDGQRWGDYSQVVVDPNDNMTMWTFQEYCEAVNSWGLRVIQVIAPSPPPAASLVPPPVVGITPSVALAITASSTPDNTGFFDPGSDAGGPGFANHLSASVTGNISVNSITFIDPAHISVDLNTSSAVAGTYPMTITNPDGQTTSVNVTIVSSFPIELVSFSAMATTHCCLVQWTTASEINNDYFTIEKSRDGIHFEEAGRVKGNGNSTSILNYTFTDEHPFPGTSYYRLMQTDFDGTSTHSDISPVRFLSPGFELVSIVPDYNTHAFQICVTDNTTENVEYRFIDVLGKIIYSGSKTVSKGSNTITIEGNQLGQGFYYLILTNGITTLARKIFY